MSNLAPACTMAPKKAPSPEPVEQEEKPKEEEVPEEILKGDFVFPDGSTYKGSYLQKGETRVIHGEGMLRCGPEVFDGTFEKGLYKKGTYTGCNGAVYFGTFKNNQMHGFGEYKWPDSRSYKGMWKEGKMHGRGKFSNFSFGQDATKEGFSFMGEFESSYAKQEEAKAKFLEEYEVEYQESALAALKDLAEKAATLSGVDTNIFPQKKYIVPQPRAQEEEETEDKEERMKVEELILPLGECPLPEQVMPEGVKALNAGLTKVEGEEFFRTQVTLLKKSSEATVINTKRLKVPGQLGMMANQQLQHVGQCVEFSALDPDGNQIGPKLALINVNRDFDVANAEWKIVHYEEPAPPPE